MRIKNQPPRAPLRQQELPRAQLKSAGEAPRAAEVERPAAGPVDGAAAPVQAQAIETRSALEGVKKGKKGKASRASAPLPPPVPREEAIALLKDAGVPEKFLAKAKDKTLQANFQKVKAGLEAGAPKIKTKFGKYTVTSKFDGEGKLVDVKVKKKSSFLKKALGVVLKVASFIPGPVGVVARVVTQVQSVVAAVRGGNILGAISGAIGGLSGIGGLGAAASRALNTAGRVVNAAQAIRNRDLGGLLGAVGANTPGLTRLTNVVNAAQAIRNRDFAGALGGLAAATNAPAGGALDRLTNFASAAQAIRNRDFGAALSSLGAGIGTPAGERLGRLGTFVSTAQNVRTAIRGGDLAGAAGQLAGFAAQNATTDASRGRLQDLSSILQAASEVRAANRAGNAELAQLGAEALARATGQAPVPPNPEDPAGFDAAVDQQMGVFFDAEAMPPDEVPPDAAIVEDGGTGG